MRIFRHGVGIFILAIATVTMAFAVQPRDRVIVDFQHSVDIGPTVLQPGHYVFQQIDDQTPEPVFMVSDQQGHNISLTAMAIPGIEGNAAALNDVPRQTKVILQKVGNQYYLDKIWIQGRVRGWQFNIPENVKSQASSMQPEEVSAQYEQNQQGGQNNANAMENSNLQSASAGSSITGTAQVNSLTGCLQPGNSANSYVLQQNGNSIQVTPSETLTYELGKQVGRSVRLVGEWTSGNSANSASDMTSASTSSMSNSQSVSNSQNNGQTFRADRIDVIAATCSSK